MLVTIRTDASVDIGMGHVMRCLTLAGSLRARGANVSFICREHTGHLCDLIESKGFGVSRLPASATRLQSAGAESPLHESWRIDAQQCAAIVAWSRSRPDLLVVDHYGLDAQWENHLRPLVGRILVIDDLADRPHSCDVLLDQNLHDSPQSRYQGLVDAAARVFVGPQYALLRPEFDALPLRLRDCGLRRLLVFFGGTDPSGEALKVVSALGALGAQAPATHLVLGPINPNARSVRDAAQGIAGLEVVAATNEMATLVATADLGIGTCGGAQWERCVLGLPSLVVVNADNQRDDARILHEFGAVRNLGEAATSDAELWATQIGALQNDPVALLRMSQAAAGVMQDRRQAMHELEVALVG